MFQVTNTICWCSCVYNGNWMCSFTYKCYNKRNNRRRISFGTHNVCNIQYVYDSFVLYGEFLGFVTWFSSFSCRSDHNINEMCSVVTCNVSHVVKWRYRYRMKLWNLYRYTDTIRSNGNSLEVVCCFLLLIDHLGLCSFFGANISIWMLFFNFQFYNTKEKKKNSYATKKNWK